MRSNSGLKEGAIKITKNAMKGFAAKLMVFSLMLCAAGVGTLSSYAETAVQEQAFDTENAAAESENEDAGGQVTVTAGPEESAGDSETDMIDGSIIGVI